MLLLYSSPALVARTVKKIRQLVLAVLKQGAVHLQTKSVVFYILHSCHFSSGPPAWSGSKIARRLLALLELLATFLGAFHGEWWHSRSGLINLHTTILLYYFTIILLYYYTTIIDQRIGFFSANRNRNRFAEPTSVQIGIGIVCDLNIGKYICDDSIRKLFAIFLQIICKYRSIRWTLTTILLYYFTTILLYYYTTILLFYYTTLQLYYYTTILLYYCTTILLYYYTTILLYYYTTILLYYYTILDLLINDTAVIRC